MLYTVDGLTESLTSLVLLLLGRHTVPHASSYKWLNNCGCACRCCEARDAQSSLGHGYRIADPRRPRGYTRCFRVFVCLPVLCFCRVLCESVSTCNRFQRVSAASVNDASVLTTRPPDPFAPLCVCVHRRRNCKNKLEFKRGLSRMLSLLRMSWLDAHISRRHRSVRFTRRLRKCSRRSSPTPLRCS